MSIMRKIAIVAPVLPERGGMGAVAWNHARLLAARGQEVTLFAPAYAKASAGRQDYGKAEAARSGDGFYIELVKPLIKYGNAAWAPNLGRSLRDFDIVMLHYPFFGGAGAVYRARKKYGFKLVVYYHMDAVGTGFKKIIFDYNTRYFLPRLIRRADLVLTSSGDLARHSHLCRYWQEGSEKFQVAAIGVDVNKFAFSRVPREKIILFVGMLDAAHYFKGVEYLIKAVSLLGREDFNAVIVGSGDLLPMYQKLARDLRVSDKIIFVGQKFGADLVPYFQKATVTVLPSVSSESFGIALVESMAAGTPVMATDLPGPRSVFEDGISGFVVPARDSRALAEKIEYLLFNPDKAREMGIAGRKLVEEKYDWEKIGDKLCTLLR